MSGPDIGDELNVLIEVVSARELLVGDIIGSSSDPYVIVMLGDEQVHRTKHIRKTLNPEWGPETESTFILHCLAYKLFDNDGLKFVVKDYDLIGRDDDLGSVVFTANQLLNGTGGLMERKIDPPPGLKGHDAGYLTIRCRTATHHDAESLAHKEHKPLFHIKTGVFDHEVTNTL